MLHPENDTENMMHGHKHNITSCMCVQQANSDELLQHGEDMNEDRALL
jgi:hypothetical protein